MTVAELAKAFTSLCADGKFEEAGRTYWSDSVVSLEPMEGPGARSEGRAAVDAKGQWWYSNHEVHSVKVEGPYVHGDQFTVRYTIDVSPKGGKRMSMDEHALYTAREGKIVEDRFFYGL